MAESVNIKKLVQADEINNGDFFIVETPQGTRILDYEDLIFSDKNTTFAPKLSAHTDDINVNLNNIAELSGYHLANPFRVQNLSATDGLSATGPVLVRDNLQATGTVSAGAGFIFPDGTKQTTANLKTVTGVFSGQTFSTTSSTLVNTPISATITPATTASRILVLSQVTCGANVNYRFGVSIARDSTDIMLGETSGSRKAVTVGGEAGSIDDNHAVPIMVVDTPATTNSITYFVKVLVQSGYTLYLNRTYNDLDGDRTMRTISTITLMEVI